MRAMKQAAGAAGDRSGGGQSAGRGERARPVRRVHVGTYVFLFCAFALIVFLIHLPLLGLPYYWDELGQFVPAALDLFRRGLWVPHMTVPNAHPPGVMAYLAAFWSVFGYSVEATRAAMLVAASFAVLLTFLLAVRMCRRARGAPAFAAVLFLLASPLFYTQAMLAQLDMPAMLFTLWALLLFFENRFAAAAVACVALVLVKETGVVVPAVLGSWLLAEGKRRHAVWFTLPGIALAAWLGVLWRSTGHPFGSASFTDYNVFYPLHPLRLGVALLRRVFFLLAADFHWVGWIAIVLAWRRSRVFRSRSWRVAGTVAVAQLAVVSVLGGATLERYLLPVLALMYIAMAAAWSALPSPRMRAAQALMAAGMALSLFWRPPYSYPFENNLAMVDFVRLQQTAARYVERNCGEETVTTSWPLTGALWQPALGYVDRRVNIHSIPNFAPAAVLAVDPGSVETFVLFSKEWERSGDVRGIPWVRRLLAGAYGYEPQVTPEEVERRFGVTRVAQWERRGQWVVVFRRKAARELVRP